MLFNWQIEVFQKQGLVRRPKTKPQMFNLIGNGSDWSSSHSGHHTTRTRGSIVCW